MKGEGKDERESGLVLHFRGSFARAAFLLRFCRPGIFQDFAKNGEERNKKERSRKMNMNWADWAVLAMMAVVMFFIPIVIGKYIDMRVRLSVKYAVKDKELNWFRKAASIEFLTAAQMWRSVPGHALAILPDGRVFGFLGCKVAEASILGCEEAYFDVMTDRAGRGMTDEEIERRVPDQETLWRVKMGDVIVYFEAVYGKGLRNTLGVDVREAAAFHVELQSVRAGIAAKAEEVRRG